MAGNHEPFPPTRATLPPTPLPRTTSPACHVPKAIPQSLSSRPLHLPAWFLCCGEARNGRDRFFYQFLFARSCVLFTWITFLISPVRNNFSFGCRFGWVNLSALLVSLVCPVDCSGRPSCPGILGFLCIRGF